MATEKTLNIAGIALEGAQAELGKLLVDNIKYEFAIKQLREIHKRNSFNWCFCEESSECQTIGILEALDI